MRNAEHYEWEYPVLYEYFRFRPRYGGRRANGAAASGMVKHVVFNSDADLTVRAVDRCDLPPQGVAGGKPGGTGGWILNRGTAATRESCR